MCLYSRNKGNPLHQVRNIHVNKMKYKKDADKWLNNIYIYIFYTYIFKPNIFIFSHEYCIYITNLCMGWTHLRYLKHAFMHKRLGKFGPYCYALPYHYFNAGVSLNNHPFFFISTILSCFSLQRENILIIQTLT